jgi:hypothetical protein
MDPVRTVTWMGLSLPHVMVMPVLAETQAVTSENPTTVLPSQASKETQRLERGSL